MARNRVTNPINLGKSFWAVIIAGVGLGLLVGTQASLEPQLGF